MKIPFSPPYIDDSVRNEIIKVLDSGWITTGPTTRQLEELMEHKYKIPSCLGVNSWTSGIIMLLKWIGVKQGDEVIIPAYTYAATALSVLHAGAKPVIVDVYDDFTINVDSIESAITEKTKAIIPVDFGGMPCRYDEINELVNKYSIKEKFVATSDFQEKLNRILVVSDAAHSIGAKYGKKNAGTLTDITVFSFHAVKNVTSAEGGLICFNLPGPFDNNQLYQRLRRFSLNGQTKDALTKSGVGSWKYDIVEMGMKCNMADLNAALALGQLKQYELLLSKRKDLFNRYNYFFKLKNWAKTPYSIDNDRETSYHIYPLRINNITEKQRDLIIEEISKQEIAVNVHFIPLPMLSLFKNMGYKVEDCPVAYTNYSCEISLPIYPQLSFESVDLICKVVDESVSLVVESKTMI